MINTHRDTARTHRCPVELVSFSFGFLFRRQLLILLKWVSNLGLLISAAMTAKIIARNLGYQLTHIVFQSQQKSITEAMTMRCVPPHVQTCLLHYTSSVFCLYNRITEPGSASMLTAIPATLKWTKSRLFSIFHNFG